MKKKERCLIAEDAKIHHVRALSKFFHADYVAYVGDYWSVCLDFLEERYVALPSSYLSAC